MKSKFLYFLILFASISTIQASERLKKEFTVAESPKLILDVDAGNVEVRPGTSDQIIVYVELPKRDRYALSSNQDGNEVRVRVKHKDEVLSWLLYPIDVVSNGEVKVRVEVPPISDLDIKASAGSIDVKAIEGNIVLATSAGSIIADSLKGDLRTTSSGGTVEAFNIDGTMDAQTSAGSIRLYDSKGSFHLETDAGSIKIVDSKGGFKAQSEVGSIEFKGSITQGMDNYLTTSVGQINVTLDEQKDIEIDAEASLGEVSIRPEPSDLRKGEHYLIAGLGEKNAVLRLRSRAGSIKIEKGLDSFETEDSGSNDEDIPQE
jgi:hypothetical protein